MATASEILKVCPIKQKEAENSCRKLSISANKRLRNLKKIFKSCSTQRNTIKRNKLEHSLLKSENEKRFKQKTRSVWEKYLFFKIKRSFTELKMTKVT